MHNKSCPTCIRGYIIPCQNRAFLLLGSTMAGLGETLDSYSFHANERANVAMSEIYIQK